MENKSFIGTLDQLFDLVPINVLFIMWDLNRKSDHIFRITLYNNYLLIW